MYCSSKSKFNGVNAPSDLATTVTLVTDCSGLDMLSRESKTYDFLVHLLVLVEHVQLYGI